MKILLIIGLLFLCACEKNSSDDFNLSANASGKSSTTVIAHTHKWSDIIVPETSKAYLDQQDYVPVKGRTTIEINATVLPADKFGIVFDKNLKVYKAWNGSTWKTLTAN